MKAIRGCNGDHIGALADGLFGLDQFINVGVGREFRETQAAALVKVLGVRITD